MNFNIVKLFFKIIPDLVTSLHLVYKKLQQWIDFFQNLAVNKEPVTELFKHSANLVVTDLEDLKLGVKIRVKADQLVYAQVWKKVCLKKRILILFLEIVPEADQNSV